VIGGDAITVDTLDSYIRTDRMLVATLGVRNLVVVEVGDSILIADREKVQGVRGLVGREDRPRLCHKA
jgi:mannose-1-phosphate guanylyltransferase